VFEIVIFILVFTTTLSGVEMFRRWSLRRNLLDIPNERSSHQRPTPRGGGLIIVLVSLATYVFYTNSITNNFLWSYFLGAVLIASISWLDDLFSISFIWRFLTHSLAAVIVISDLGYFREIYIPYFEQTNIGILGAFLTFFWIVWLTNAYNFMDGIDGIAAMQAVTAGIGWMVIGSILELNTASFYGGIIAFSSLGFLIHNWHPAKIFMGDVGSAFLGYTFAVIPLFVSKEKSNYASILPIISVLLVWFFIFDTILTFIRRSINKEKVWQAHRSHIYQRLVIAGHSHIKITNMFGILSIMNVIMIIISLKANQFWMILLPLIVISSTGLLIFSVLQEKRKLLN
jgi:UDP-N-acetylmuramyl pentapeptide phosphotransferase/UDP-N-acetylglucosamine-1-phosphate transferase